MKRVLLLTLVALGFVLGTVLHEPLFAADPVEVGYRDFSFGSSLASGATGEKPESKLWWNDGSWWGCLYDRSRGRHSIYKFDVTTQNWQNTGVGSDNREASKADVLWDPASGKLYIATHCFSTAGSPNPKQDQWGRLYRYTYDSTAEIYLPDAGFPVLITQGRSEALTIAKDSTGKLWVTYVENQRVMVNRSTTSEDAWGTPFILPSRGTTGQVSRDDISAILAFQDNKIGVMWSNQNSHKIYFAVHADGDPETTWSDEETALPGPSGEETADDHINLKSLVSDGSGRVFAAIKTSLTSTNAPLVMLLVRDLQGNWTKTVFGRVIDNHTRPIVLIAEDLRQVFIFAQADDPNGGKSIYYKSSSLDDISFPAGKGEFFIRSSLDPDVNNPTSTKQNLSATTGLLVLASDDSTHYYLHNYLPLGQAYNLTVNVQGQGSVTPPGGSFMEGSSVSLTATASSGYQFSGWSGDLAGTANPASLVMDADKSVTATFTAVPHPEHTLSIMTSGAGSVTLEPAGGVYEEGTVVQLTAVPDSGYQFTGWGGDLSGSASPTTITIDANKVVSATFTVIPVHTVAFQEAVTGASQNLNTVQTSTNVTGVAGDLYLVAVSTRSLRTVTAVNGLGLTWSQVRSQCSGRGVTGVSIWAARGTPSGDGPVTATLSGTALNAVLVVARYSGVNPSAAIGNVVSANTNGVSGLCANGIDASYYAFAFTTTQTNSTVFAAVALRGRTHDPGFPFEERAEVHVGASGDVAGIAVMDRTVASPTSVTVDGAFNAITDWAVVAVEIVP